MAENKIVAEIVSVKDVLDINTLRIPVYQRPYLWKVENVRQMLEDIRYSKESGKIKYRIGSVILHQENNVYNIVDGQQRLTTLYLLKKACGDSIDDNLKFNHTDSYKHIKENYTYIQSWIKENYSATKEEFWKYVEISCEFVRIIVTDLSEAFQMFDSQNGRGKELEAYNLLKAYHIRAMEQESQDDKIRCDKRWEEATQYDATPKIKNDPNIDVLKQLFDEQLYRSRIWARRKDAWNFSKKKIGEFKGFTIDKNHPVLFPYQNPQLLQYLTSKFYKNVLSGTVATQNRFNTGDDEKIDPFVNVTQQIVNGKPFFDYIETYVEIYKRMFIDIGTYQLREFKEFYYTYCLNYGVSMENRKNNLSFHPQGQALRDGDTYLREVYKSLVFVLFDRFGENVLNKFYKTLYRIVYCLRLQKGQIKYAFMAKFPSDSELFEIIDDAKTVADLSKLAEKLPKENKYEYQERISAPEVRNFIIKGE